jgi:hypothetical protein
MIYSRKYGGSSGRKPGKAHVKLISFYKEISLTQISLATNRKNLHIHFFHKRVLSLKK